MNAQDVIDLAIMEVGYHEKEYGTPVPDLYPPTNAYDGNDNWTKYHNDISVSQGQAWCGFFCYWLFYQMTGSFPDTEDFLHNISNYSPRGGAVSSWANAFSDVGLWHEGDGYEPKPGDIVVFSDTGVPWSHCEIITGTNSWPSTIDTVGGNTRNPYDPGDQSEGMWVAARTRSATATSGFHVRGYCEVEYDGSGGGISIDLIWKLLKKPKIKGTGFLDKP